MTASSPQADVDPLARLSAQQKSKLERYLAALLTANESFNLTAVRSRDEAWDRHIVESARLASFVEKSERLLDVGSGGGLPGIVLAICSPNTAVSLLEATQKKALFLEASVKQLGLTKTRVVCDRAETAGAPGSPYREAFDTVTARAVAPLPTLLEITIPFLKVGGTLVALKGQRAEEEIEAAKRAFSVLKCQLEQVCPTESGNVLLIKKMERTGKNYPRRPGTPKRDPL